MSIVLAWLILLGLIAAFITGLYSQYSYWNKDYLKLLKKEGKKRKEGFLEIKRSENNLIKPGLRRGVDWAGYRMGESLEIIDAPVVIGENVVQKMKVSSLTLDVPAIKIKDIDVSLRRYRNRGNRK